MSRAQVGAAALTPFPTIDDRVQASIELWARDLRQLFEDAKDRFSDVSWETDAGDRVWAHKAVVYVRAPKAFKDRYFITTAKSITLARSPTSLSSATGPSPTPYLLSASSVRGTPSPNLWRGAASSLSVNTTASDGTLRAPPTVSVAGSTSDGVLRLRHEDAPELFAAQLEWLYTGEGFGDVVEWISGEREGNTSSGTRVRDSLGRRGNLADRRDKLGQDLTYMWTSKLYCDVRIHLESPDGEGYDSDSSGASEDSLASTVIFTAHRFMLVSRSRYFASLFLNEGDFRPSTADVHLPTPPFTPAALHFCLGWMYAGNLDFSNRSYDLLTAFQIYRAAEYLQLDCLVEEIESRIVHDFCHGLDYDRCHCRRCFSRVPRVWRFAGASDVGALELQRHARRFILRGWGETWGREIGMADKAERDDLSRDVVASMTPNSVMSAFRGVAQIRRRIDHWQSTRGQDTTGWVDALGEMIEPIERRARELLVSNFTQVCESKELWSMFGGKGFSDEVLDTFFREVVDMTGRSPTFTLGPKVYQTLVGSLLRKTDPSSLEAMLPIRSANRHKVETAKGDVAKHIKKRWTSIQSEGGFLGLDAWAIKAISDDIGVPVSDLAVRAVPFPRARDNGFPRTSSRAVGLGDSAGPRQRRTSMSPETPTDSSGLRRLRLSSSASVSSATSVRSAAAERSAAGAASSSSSAMRTGPQARSPTAAEKTPLVTVGSKRLSGLRSGNSSPTPTRQGSMMSGPPRPLLTGRASSVARETKRASTSSSTPSSPAVSSPLSPTPRAESPAPLRQTDSPVTLRHHSSIASIRSAASASSTATAKTTTTKASTRTSTSTATTAAPSRAPASSSKAHKALSQRMPPGPSVPTTARPSTSLGAKAGPRGTDVAAVKPPTRTRTVSGAAVPKPPVRTRTVSAVSRTTTSTTATAASATATRQRTVSSTSTRTRTQSAASLAPSVAGKATSTASRVSATSGTSTTSKTSALAAAKPRASTGNKSTRAAAASKAPPVPKVPAGTAKAPIKTVTPRSSTAPVRPVTSTTASKPTPGTKPTAGAAPRASTGSTPRPTAKPPTLKTSASTKSLVSRASLGAPKTPTASSTRSPTTPGTRTPVTPGSSSRLSAVSASATRARATSLNPQATPPPRPRTSSSTTPWKRATPLPPSVAGVAGQRVPRQRPSLRSLSGSTEGPPEAVTPRVSEVSEPILVLDEDSELVLRRDEEHDTLQEKEKEIMAADTGIVPPVPSPSDVRRDSIVVEMSVPEEDEEIEDKVVSEAESEVKGEAATVVEPEVKAEEVKAVELLEPEQPTPVERAPVYAAELSTQSPSKLAKTADETVASIEQMDRAVLDTPPPVPQLAVEESSATSEADTASIAEEADLEDEVPPVRLPSPQSPAGPVPIPGPRTSSLPRTPETSAASLPKTPESTLAPSQRSPEGLTLSAPRTPDGSSLSAPRTPNGTSLSAPRTPENGSLGSSPAGKTPTPGSPFPPSRTRTPTASSSSHRSPVPPPASLPSPPKAFMARSPRSSYTAPSVISRTASESGSLRSLNTLNSGWHPAHAFDPPKRAAPPPRPPSPPPVPEETDNCVQYEGPGVYLHLGIPCIVTLSGRRARFKANVKYLGRMAGKSGPWVGLEVDDLDRLGVDTLPTGAVDGIRYFHFTPPAAHPSDAERTEKAERARKLALITDEMQRTARGESLRPRNQLGLGLGAVGVLGRSNSPFSVPEWGPERPRALFVRPAEVLFVMGSD